MGTKNRRRPAAAPAPAAGKLRLGLVQMACGEDPGENLARALGHAEAAAKKGADVVLLQELFTSRYFCYEENHDWFRLAEPVPGPTTTAVGRVAKATKTTIVAPFFEKRAAGVYHNSAAVIGPDGAVKDVYRKMHIPDDPGYYEKFYFTPGDAGFKAHKAPRGTLGTLICWDQWFPEAARLTALAGAEVLLYPTAIGGIPKDSAQDHLDQRDAWETMQRAHAISNGVFVAAVNRVGTEHGVKFWGGSFVCDPLGRVLARAGREKDEVLLVDCDLSRVEYARQHWPFLRDRRIDAYIGLIRRFGE
jgi:N-carbamoylputrescine amidase